jgi:hypothetical protein
VGDGIVGGGRGEEDVDVCGYCVWTTRSRVSRLCEVQGQKDGVLLRASVKSAFHVALIVGESDGGAVCGCRAERHALGD